MPTRRPTQKELSELDSIKLTPNVTEWNPHDDSYSQQEYSMLNYRGEIKFPEDKNAPRRFIVTSMITNMTDPIAFDRSISELVDDRNETEHTISSIRHNEVFFEVYDK